MKKENLKKYGMVVLVMLFVGASNMQAQQMRRGQRPSPQEQQHGQKGKEMNERGPRGPHIPNLSEEQKEQMKSFKLALEKEALPIKNQVGEKEARLRTLTTADSYNENAVNKVIEEIGELKTELMKLKVANTAKVKDILTDEQLVFFNKHAGKGGKDQKGGKPQRGPRPGGR